MITIVLEFKKIVIQELKVKHNTMYFLNVF